MGLPIAAMAITAWVTFQSEWLSEKLTFGEQVTISLLLAILVAVLEMTFDSIIQSQLTIREFEIWRTRNRCEQLLLHWTVASSAAG